MTENSIDVNIVPVKNGAKRVVVSYYHYSRKEKDRMSSQTDYVWETKNEEMFKYFEARRTKVFYSQILAMCRFYGKKNVRKYKKVMILKTTTNEFCFINVSFYETIADPRHFFEQDYEEMPEYEEESDFDFDSYYNKFIPFVQEWANEVSERLYGYGVNSIKVTSVGYPKEYNYGTDWMNVEFCDEWRQKMLSNISKIVNDDKCKKYAETNYRSVSGYIFLGPEDLKEFEKEIIERKSDSGYDVTILLNMYLTLAFVKEFGFKAGEAWSEITEYAYGCLSYSDFATTEMLKWAKEKGLTIEELSI